MTRGKIRPFFSGRDSSLFFLGKYGSDQMGSRGEVLLRGGRENVLIHRRALPFSSDVFRALKISRGRGGRGVRGRERGERELLS